MLLIIIKGNYNLIKNNFRLLSLPVSILYLNEKRLFECHIYARTHLRVNLDSVFQQLIFELNRPGRKRTGNAIKSSWSLRRDNCYVYSDRARDIARY